MGLALNTSIGFSLALKLGALHQALEIVAPMGLYIIETTIERDKMGGSVSLPLSLTVLCGGFPRKFVSDLESAHLSGSTLFGGS